MQVNSQHRHSMAVMKHIVQQESIQHLELILRHQDLLISGSCANQEINEEEKECSVADDIINDQFNNINVHDYSVSGANLNMTCSDLSSVRYLADGGNNKVYTAVMNSNNQPQQVVIKKLRFEVMEDFCAIDEIESEINIHSHLDHENIVSLKGAGYDRKWGRFIVLEKLEGGTLEELLHGGCRPRKGFFFKSAKRNKLHYIKVLKYAQQIAAAMDYLHRIAFDGSMVLHRDLKPNNIGFATDGTLKVFDFGLSTIVPNSSPYSDEIYELSGQTGSLRYMAPEVANRKPYNHKVDVYSFGIILWELFACRKPFENMDAQQYYKKVVHGGERPAISRKFPNDLVKMIRSCWDVDPQKRPAFQRIVSSLTEMLNNEVSDLENLLTKLS